MVPLQMMADPVDLQEDHGDSVPKLELGGGVLVAQWRDILIRECGETFEEIVIFCDTHPRDKT